MFFGPCTYLLIFFGFTSFEILVDLIKQLRCIVVGGILGWLMSDFKFPRTCIYGKPTYSLEFWLLVLMGFLLGSPT